MGAWAAARCFFCNNAPRAFFPSAPHDAVCVCALRNDFDQFSVFPVFQFSRGTYRRVSVNARVKHPPPPPQNPPFSTPLLRTFPLPSQRPTNRGVPPAARRGGAVVPPHLPEVCAPRPPPPRRPPRRAPAPPAAASQRWRRPGAGAPPRGGGPRAATPALIFCAAPRRRRFACRYIRVLAARLIFREPPGVRARPRRRAAPRFAARACKKNPFYSVVRLRVVCRQPRRRGRVRIR